MDALIAWPDKVPDLLYHLFDETLINTVAELHTLVGFEDERVVIASQGLTTLTHVPTEVSDLFTSQFAPPGTYYEQFFNHHTMQTEPGEESSDESEFCRKGYCRGIPGRSRGTHLLRQELIFLFSSLFDQTF